MSKTKWYILGSIFFCLAFVVLLPAKAGASTTFPTDQAGISAYVRLDNIEALDLIAFAETLATIETLAESYVVGTVQTTNSPHLYLGLDGWMVAYFLNTEEASKIMQWQGYTQGSINTTTLKDAIDYITQINGLTYSEPIRYYDFEFPEANNMTLVAEEGTNNFYVSVPGTLYEASYGVILRSQCCSGFDCKQLKLKVGETLVYQSQGLGCGFTCSPPFSTLGYYDLSVIPTGITHNINFSDQCGSAAYATVLIYKN